MTQFATNGRPSGSSGSGWETAGQHDLMIRLTMAVFLGRVIGCRASPHTEPPVCTLHPIGKCVSETTSAPDGCNRMTAPTVRYRALYLHPLTQLFGIACKWVELNLFGHDCTAMNLM